MVVGEDKVFIEIENSTGTVIGRLSKEELRSMVVSTEDKELRRKFVHWLETLITEGSFTKLGLVISLPLRKQTEREEKKEWIR